MVQTPVLVPLSALIDQRKTHYRWIDLYSADFIARGLSKEFAEFKNAVAVIVCHLSYCGSKGQVSVSLSDLRSTLARGYSLPLVADDTLDYLLAGGLAELGITQLIEGLDNASDLETVWQSSSMPLVLKGDQLYLARYWNLYCEFEIWLAHRIRDEIELSSAQIAKLSTHLRSVFQLDKSGQVTGVQSSNSSKAQIDWQAVSAAHALLQKTTFIAGGPGTGKTTTAASLLFLVGQSYLMRVGRFPRVRLLAPTGKAAVRLADSISFQLKRIEKAVSQTGEVLSKHLPDNGETIHRFLNEHRALDSKHSYVEHLDAERLLFGHVATRQTNADVLIVDESSMIDLSLMVALIETVPDNTQIIFMGDPYQLPPVEPGEVFSDVVRRFQSAQYCPDFAVKLESLTGYDPISLGAGGGDQYQTSTHNKKVLCYLSKTYRFGGDLKTAAEQINSGEFEKFCSAFMASKNAENSSLTVRWYSVADNNEAGLVADSVSLSQLSDQILVSYESFFNAVIEASNVHDLNQAFSEFQLLCSTHDGPQGVTAMNQMVEGSLLQRLRGKDTRINDITNYLYHGKPVLITKNHAELGVFNGDIGFVVHSDDDRGYLIEVPQGEGVPVRVSPKRISAWQPAYAMTVHKSQGSEYQEVGLLMADYARELLSRALLYTGLTRAKQKCTIWAKSDALRVAFEQ